MADVIKTDPHKAHVTVLSDYDVRLLNLREASKSSGKNYRISNERTIKLCPVWAYEKDEKSIIENTLALPISPSDIMFNNDSNKNTLNLINYGELPSNVNRKLSTWTVTSIFPEFRQDVWERDEDSAYIKTAGRYWFDLSADNGQQDYEAYGDYCNRLWDWYINQTPLVFMYKTWGNYYYCQITNFTFGNKDATKNVYYNLNFQEYRKYMSDKYNTMEIDWDSETYTVSKGENLLGIAKKIYGNSDYFVYLMELNKLKNTEITEGDVLSVK